MSLAAVESRPFGATDDILVTVEGKLVEQRFNEGVYYSTLVRPALDVYSSPMPFEVRSDKQLGQRNEVIAVNCKLTGFFKKQYDVTNPQTGEVRRVRPIACALEAVF